MLRVAPAGDTGKINGPPRRRAQDPDSTEDRYKSTKVGVAESRVLGTLELPEVVHAGNKHGTDVADGLIWVVAHGCTARWADRASIEDISPG